MTCQVVDMTINNECHVRVELDYYSRVLSYILQGAVCRGFLVFVTYHNKDRTYAYDVGNISSAKFIITYKYKKNEMSNWNDQIRVKKYLKRLQFGLSTRHVVTTWSQKYVEFDSDGEKNVAAF